jgi:hypothetical protein
MNKKTFSLVEMMVAFALTTLITSACSKIFLDTKEVSDTIWSLAQCERQSSAIMESFKKDLQSICPPLSNHNILRVDSREENNLRKDSCGFLSVRSTPDGLSCAEVEYLSSPGKGDEKGFRVYRRFSNLCDNNLQAGGLYELLLRNVLQFKCEYLVKNEWTAMPTEIPQALHLQISLWSEQLQKEHHSETFILIPSVL